MIKMIVMDMDGTLLNDQEKIMPETKEALLACQKKGVRLVLASGRNHRKLLPYAEELEMKAYGGYLLEINGLAKTNLADGSREVKARFQAEDIQNIFSLAKQYHVEFQAVVDEGLYTYIPPKMYEEKIAYREKMGLPEDYPLTAGAFTFIHDNRKGYPHQVYIQDSKDIEVEVNKICISYDEDQVEAFAKIAKEKFQGQYWIGRTSARWLEFMPLGVSKGHAVAELAEELHIPKDEIMAFGDGENDIEMLTTVGYGIAMGNALQSVKDIAFAVTDDHNHEGIAKAIKKYCE